MCGRFALEVPWDVVVKLLEAKPVDGAEWSAAYNICPTDPAPVARLDKQGRRELRIFRWGLVPWWAKEPRVGARMINARSETVATKRAFRDAFRERRCLVPASGFYEWTLDADGKGKTPHWIHAPGGAPLVFAGLWAKWRPPEGEPLRTFTILTTDANESVQPLHDRMPVVLDADAQARWMDPRAAPSELQALLGPSAAPLVHYEVAKTVNNVRADGPALIAPARPRPENLELAL